MIWRNSSPFKRKKLFSISGGFAVSVLTGAYATGRKIQILVDRRQHQQNIGLRSSESRSCWLGIAGNLIGFASGFATVVAGVSVASSDVMTLAGEIVLKSVKTGSVVVNVVRVPNVLTNTIRKLLTRRKFATRLTDIYNCDNHHSQTEKSHEKMWGVVKIFVTEEVFRKKCRIPGIPKDHFLQEVFKILKDNEKYVFPLLNVEAANTSAQDEAQISFDVNRTISHLFDNTCMLGLACNEMQSEEQYCEMAAELTGNRDSIYMSECVDTAIINPYPANVENMVSS